MLAERNYCRLRAAFAMGYAQRPERHFRGADRPENHGRVGVTHMRHPEGLAGEIADTRAEDDAAMIASETAQPLRIEADRAETHARVGVSEMRDPEGLAGEIADTRAEDDAAMIASETAQPLRIEAGGQDRCDRRGPLSRIADVELESPARRP